MANTIASVYDDILRDVTTQYIDSLDPDNIPDTATIKGELMGAISVRLQMENATREKGMKYPVPKTLPNAAIVDLMLSLYPIRNISLGKDCCSRLAIYISDENDKDYGIYSFDEKRIKAIIRELLYTCTSVEAKEIIEALQDKAPQTSYNEDPNIIGVNNGIFDYKDKILLPFSPDTILITKSRVNYNMTATNVVIHNDEDDTDWDVERWMNDLSDDPEIVKVLWEVAGAIIRPNVKWNKMVNLYNTSGNNGKGTYAVMLKNLCGNYASIPISEFSNDFMLEQLLGKTAIICDENPVDAYSSKLDKLKAIITQDIISFNVKFKAPTSMVFRGLNVQCLNELPRSADKTDSFYRRQLFIPFDKCFTGVERKYIKDDYLNRPEVLEYVLYKMLNTDYYELSTPFACIELLGDVKVLNNPVRQFTDEFFNDDNFVWNILPDAFLYDLYKSWFSKNNPNGKIQAKTAFASELHTIIDRDYPEWQSLDNKNGTKVTNAMNMGEPEYLIIKYNLLDWMHDGYTENQTLKATTPPKSKIRTGFLRKNFKSKNVLAIA